jgi:hypothetical protein
VARNEEYYDDDESFDYGSLPIEQQQEFLYETIGFTEFTGDIEAHNLFWEVMYNDELTAGERAELQQELSDYLWEEYGIDFDDVWDWEDFRSWYDAA